MKKMTNDKYGDALITLRFYLNITKEVHIRIIRGIDSGLFRNGNIIDVNFKDKTFIIVDRVLGNKKYSVYDIDTDIVPYKEVDNNDR